MSLASSSSSTPASALRSAINSVKSTGGLPCRRSTQTFTASLPRPYSASAAALSPDPEPIEGHYPPHLSEFSPSRTRPPTNARSLSRTTPASAQAYLSDLLRLPSSAAFPPGLALQILTHKSYRYAHVIRHPSPSSPYSSSSPSSHPSPTADQLEASSAPHNARLSFLGRRAIASYLSLFVHSSIPSSRDLRSIDFLRGKGLDEKLAGMRHVVNLGREVGEKWRVGEVIRWDHNETSHASGDLKVKGIAVESILGGIFTHLGSPAAQRAFHLHVLPHLTFKLRDPRLIERAKEMKAGVEGELNGGIVPF